MREIVEIGNLPGEPLLDIRDVADLHRVIYPVPRIIGWRLEDWRREIAKRLDR